MSFDDDLEIECPCGCTKVTKRGGYQTCDIADMKDIGYAASGLCRRSVRRRRILILSSSIAVTTLLVLFILGCIRHENRIMEAGEYRREAEVRLQADDVEGAVQAFTRSLSIRPSIDSYLDRGFCYYQLGEYEKSIADCDEALRLDPTNEAAKKNRDLARRYSHDATR